MTQDNITTACEQYQRDIRFRMLVDSAAHAAREEFGPVDPEHAERDAMEIARLTGAILTKRIYEEDRELNAMRVERDHYKKIAESSLHTQPIRMVPINPQYSPTRNDY